MSVDDAAGYRLRLPRPDDVVPGRRHADGGADGVEDLGGVDRFCDAMLAIRAEIDRVAAGEGPRGVPAAARSAHGAGPGGEWERGYSRELGVFPAGVDPDKYRRRWPGSTRRTATVTSCAPARRPRRSLTDEERPSGTCTS